MQVKDLLNIKGISLANKADVDKKIDGFYTCDLLSFALGHITNDNVTMLSVINSVNIVAVASMLNMSSIILTNGVIPAPEVIEKANLENIPVLSSNLSSADLLKEIYKYEAIL